MTAAEWCDQFEASLMAFPEYARQIGEWPTFDYVDRHALFERRRRIRRAARARKQRPGWR